MLGELHGLLLSLALSAGDFHTYRVSLVKEKITKLGSWGLYENIVQFTSATVVLASISAIHPPLPVKKADECATINVL
jgi:hypothetical protein